MSHGRNTIEAPLSRSELYRLLDEGREALRAGRKRPAKDVLRDIRQEIVA